jgi:hypothetical protein
LRRLPHDARVRERDDGDPIPLQRGPGGDFSWLKYDYTWTSPRAGSERGSRHGHSIVAPDFGYDAETRLTGNIAPGGTYPVGTLHCSSCHDPHGKYRLSTAGTYSTTGQPIWASGSYGEEPDSTYAVGSYRLLGGVGYKPMSVTVSGLAFTNPPPAAVAPGTYNRSEGIDNYTRVAYGSGMSEWCANCHPSIHNPTANVGTWSATAGLRHPTGAPAKLAGTNAQGTAFDFAANYNAYVKTGDVTGAAGSSFLSLVQFEEGTSNIASLASHANIDGSYLTGPAGTANVSCMSCHRAHATAFQSMTRWENKSEFLTVDRGAGPEYADGFAHPDEGAEARGKNAAAYLAGMNEIPASKFSGWQRSLCNKCHVKD